MSDQSFQTTPWFREAEAGEHSAESGSRNRGHAHFPDYKWRAFFQPQEFKDIFQFLALRLVHSVDRGAKMLLISRSQFLGSQCLSLRYPSSILGLRASTKDGSSEYRTRFSFSPSASFDLGLPSIPS